MESQTDTSISISSLPELVLIGGGNGTSALLEGLKEQNFNLTAIVNTVDDGGSTGKLRKQYPGLIGIGDIRQCMRALSNNPQITKMFRQRDKEGHSIGNLLLIKTALELGGMHQIESAIQIWEKKMKTNGSVIPVSTDSADLKLSFPFIKEESFCVSQYKIAHHTDRIKSRLGKLSLTPSAHINSRAEEAIRQADVILLAPGNFYGSIIPPLLTSGLKETIEESEAPFVMIGNLINICNTWGFRVEDYVSELKRQTGLEPDLFIAHNNVFDPDIKIGRKEIVEIGTPSLELVSANLLNDNHLTPDPNDQIAATRSKLRHDGSMIGSILQERFQIR